MEQTNRVDVVAASNLLTTRSSLPSQSWGSSTDEVP
jgi:hypothetical protein